MDWGYVRLFMAAASWVAGACGAYIWLVYIKGYRAPPTD